MMKLTINDNVFTPRNGEGKTLLQIMQAAGIEVPTLCYHPSLEPYGGCRLCVVEISRPSWNGWSRLVVSCAYPAEDGLIVKTHSHPVIEARQFVIELLLARCPDNAKIRSLAVEYGVTECRFVQTDGGSGDSMRDCILCGLCVRVCRDIIGANVLSLAYRGVERKVMTPFDESSDVCLTCGACAYVCPTDAITVNDILPYRVMETWHTRRELQRCTSCGKYFVPVLLNDTLKLKLNTISDLQDCCPDCRRKHTVANMITVNTGRHTRVEDYCVRRD